MQNVYGVLSVTQVQYPALVDLSSLSTTDFTQAEISMLTNALLPQGRKFRPFSAVTRSDLASTFVRAESVPQYLAGLPMFSDVRDMTTRNAVKSAQSNPASALFFDAEAGSGSRPDEPATRLVAAVAHW